MINNLTKHIKSQNFWFTLLLKYGIFLIMVAKELKIGNIVEMDGHIYTCVWLQHVQQPRLAPFIKVQMKNIKTGAMLETNLKVTDKLNEVQKEVSEMQFLYADGELYYFMDPVTFEQTPIAYDEVKQAMRYNIEGATYLFTHIDGRLISVAPQTFVVLEVTETMPATAGDTAKSALKDAKLESGVTIKVPMFVKNGDKIKVDTRTDSYVERA